MFSPILASTPKKTWINRGIRTGLRIQLVKEVLELDYPPHGKEEEPIMSGWYK
jgi:hypothetical protein